MGKDFFEDNVELNLFDLPVSVLINRLDEAVDLLLGDLFWVSKVLQSVVDEIGDFLGVECSAVVGVVLGEDGIDCLLELGVSIRHAGVLLRYI